MRVFIAGATGAIGKALLPRLLASGHEVWALARDMKKAGEAIAMGAQVVLADALDPGELTAAVKNARPEVVIHELTALKGVADFKRFDELFALTNRFRTEVTDTLMAAARLVGARRFIAQSYCGWPFERVGSPVKTEDDPLDFHPPAAFRKSLAAIRYLEDAVRGAWDLRAVALRYGALYGPGTGIAKDGNIVALVRDRKIPIVGNGSGIWSFLHVADAASATVRAVVEGDPGIYNVVDDDPAPVASWLPALAKTLGAKPPRHVPVWVGRLAIGEGGVSVMTSIRGGSTVKAKRLLGWRPAHPTWRRGFVSELG
jgi:nucleoside-diphosphate-sugar epimerase